MRNPDVLRAQLAAILRAASGRPVRILVPLVTLPGEMEFFRSELNRAIASEGADPAGITLGMMVETPAAALQISSFDADFYALGTNDLTQYTLAVFPRWRRTDRPSRTSRGAVELVCRSSIMPPGTSGPSPCAAM